MAEPRPVLEVSGVTRVFGTGLTALQDVSFTVAPGEFLTVIGRSGCGKSTLARILAGIDAPTRGAVRLDGVEVTGPSRDRGMVFQGYTLFPWLTVRQNVMFGPLRSGCGKAEARARAEHWVRLVHLQEHLDDYPHMLSGGMKQRVAIARALANQPRVLLMDEPFAALDAQTRAAVREELLRIWEAARTTVVFITHDLDEAVLLADRILVLKPRPGRIDRILQVPLARPRGAGVTGSAGYLALRAEVDRLIHAT